MLLMKNTSTAEENNGRVRDMILEDPRVIIDEVAHHLRMTESSMTYSGFLKFMQDVFRNTSQENTSLLRPTEPLSG